jgi:intraflagellar transport protein 172
MHKWDEALHVAEMKNHPELHNLRHNYYQWLMDTNQEGKAGELKEREGDDMAAINLYMKAGMPARAARLATQRDEFVNNSDLIQVS